MARALQVMGQEAERRERADAQRNRVRILAAARKLAKKQPLDELCMDEVAQLAGLGKGTLYRRFKDKAALLHALLDESERDLQRKVKDDFAGRQQEPREQLVWLLDEFFAFVVENASILAAAEASTRAPPRVLPPPYAWRARLLAESLERASIARGAAAAQVADMLLGAMAADIVVRALQRDTRDAVCAAARACFRSILEQTPRASSSVRAMEKR